VLIRSGLNDYVQSLLNSQIRDIANASRSHVLAVYGPFVYRLDQLVRDELERINEQTKNRHVAVLLDSVGGSVEVVERIVETIRHFYDEVTFIIPDRAMSAGTIFAMAGDSIMMDYFSRLGPIDPQVVNKEGKLVPALSYLVQYQKLLEKDRQGELTTAEFALVSKLDLAELHQFEEARELSISLLKNWLARYKFKDWQTTNTRELQVTQEMKITRAAEIATQLSDNTRWHSHGRGISRSTLETDLNLRIDHLEDNQALAHAVAQYHALLVDVMQQRDIPLFVQGEADDPSTQRHDSQKP
jgi:membrane-bound ClpP family serine protease